MTEKKRRFHVNPETGRPNICRATVRDCPHGGEDEHFDSTQEAREHFEKANHKKIVETLSRREQVRYSFIENFKRVEETFEHDFENVPNRFFNSDLRGKNVGLLYDIDDYLSQLDAGLVEPRFVNVSGLASRLSASMSQPDDAGAEEKDILDAIRDTGGKFHKKVENVRLLKAFKADEGWVAVIEGKTVLFTRSPQGSKNLRSYRMRIKIDDLPDGYHVTVIDVRTLVGSRRVKRKTGRDVLAAAMKSKVGSYRESYVASNAELLRTLSDLEKAQLEGRNFKAQKKYVKDSASSVASAWEDKKNYKDTHRSLMESTRMNKWFSKVDIDDAVLPEEFEDFVQAYEQVKDKLPPIPEDRKPRLGIRALGKHRAVGLYAPTVNALLVDIRDSSAFVHEYGHFIDLTLTNSSSLRPEFTDVCREYSKKLKVPSSEPSSRFEYLTTPTEIQARLTELYVHERLGVTRSRLLNPDKFTEYDYAPFKEDPELKAKAFEFLDKVFEEAHDVSRRT